MNIELLEDGPVKRAIETLYPNGTPERAAYKSSHGVRYYSLRFILASFLYEHPNKQHKKVLGSATAVLEGKSIGDIFGLPNANQDELRYCYGIEPRMT